MDVQEILPGSSMSKSLSRDLERLNKWISYVSLVLRFEVTVDWYNTIPVFDIVEVLIRIHFVDKWQSDNQPTYETITIQPVLNRHLKLENKF